MSETTLTGLRRPTSLSPINYRSSAGLQLEVERTEFGFPRHPLSCRRLAPDAQQWARLATEGQPMDKNDLILISVDDHIIEPADMFDQHLPARYKESAPRVVVGDDGTSSGTTASSADVTSGSTPSPARPEKMFNIDATSYEEMRPGCFNVDELTCVQ